MAFLFLIEHHLYESLINLSYTSFDWCTVGYAVLFRFMLVDCLFGYCSEAFKWLMNTKWSESWFLPSVEDFHRLSLYLRLLRLRLIIVEYYGYGSGRVLIHPWSCYTSFFIVHISAGAWRYRIRRLVERELYTFYWSNIVDMYHHGPLVLGFVIALSVVFVYRTFWLDLAVSRCRCSSASNRRISWQKNACFIKLWAVNCLAQLMESFQ